MSVFTTKAATYQRHSTKGENGENVPFHRFTQKRCSEAIPGEKVKTPLGFHLFTGRFTPAFSRAKS